MGNLSLEIGLVARFNLHGGGGGLGCPPKLPLDREGNESSREKGNEQRTWGRRST